MAEEKARLSVAEIRNIAADACLACGASAATAKSLVEATLSAALRGRPEVGLPHFIDYLRSFVEGRIDGKAQPRMQHPLPAFIHSDAKGGIAQLGFDLAFEDLVKRARTFGVAIFSQRNSYTAGELGYYVRRLAVEGLVSMAVANAHALMAAAAGGKPVFGTNPLAFGAPLPAPQAPLIIDQAASATAFVNIVRAAADNVAIPEGWATDEAGAVTTDPAKAILGALLPFGGYKGANIALLVEVLSAGLSGAAWSLDAGNFRSGNEPPNVGLTVIAIAPAAVDPSFALRSADHFGRLQELGVHIPGSGSAVEAPNDADEIEIDARLLEEIRGFRSG
ncbi:(2R)-3-sulfolactate dehydrogenase (NADP+) [Sinorhizobium fredii]|uniref:Putative oxidoreductase YjmC n=1 Tax=Sinorhizobium fredii (strain USDA 257) TaxID=1185652 RepID=I3X5M3_SINF2|nr:Ldh family oxidoreductase [Sinorhizobium fredii]AFL51179.1 putative oxidoreductase YjmC [Sinorhizobium fredii USDA 257]